MDPSTKRRMRSAHAKRATPCPCGREVYGNGWKSHARTCATWLAEHGWPLDGGLRLAILEERGADGVRAAECEIARHVLAARKRGYRTPPSWSQVKEWAWQAADTQQVADAPVEHIGPHELTMEVGEGVIAGLGEPMRGFRAVCSCGWVGKWWTTNACMGQGRRHRAAMIRNQQVTSGDSE